MKSMYPIQIVLVAWLFGRNLLSTLGAPLKKCKKQFHNQNPGKIKSYEIHVPNSDWICFWTCRGQFAKYPAPPLHKCKKQIINKVQKMRPKPDEIYVPNSDCICFLIIRWNLLSTLCPPCKNETKSRRGLQNLMKSMYPIQIGFCFWLFGGNLLSTLGAPC